MRPTRGFSWQCLGSSAADDATQGCKFAGNCGVQTLFHVCLDDGVIAGYHECDYDQPNKAWQPESSSALLDIGVSFEIIWMDDDLIEVRVQASNGLFAATADCYCGHDSISRLAQAARGFPSSSQDRRELELGTIDPGGVGGGAKLVLHCSDQAGHAVATIVMRHDVRTSDWPDETASFSFPVEPASIDDFIADLGRMAMVVGAVAKLRLAT